MILSPRKHEVNDIDDHVSAANTFKYVWNVVLPESVFHLIQYRIFLINMNCVYVNRDTREALFYRMNRKYVSI